MPAKSQAQRGFLNARFGHKWVNKGELPAKVEGLTARAMFEREHLTEGRDDAPTLGLGKTGLKFARMTSREAFKTTGGTDEKWRTSAKLRAELAGEKPGSAMQSKDAVGKVPSAIKDSRSVAEIVARLLN